MVRAGPQRLNHSVTRSISRGVSLLIRHHVEQGRGRALRRCISHIYATASVFGVAHTHKAVYPNMQRWHNVTDTPSQNCIPGSCDDCIM